MNYGEQIVAFIQSFKDFEYSSVKSANTKTVTITVKDNDRGSAQDKIEKALIKNGFAANKITRDVVSGSTFPATIVQLSQNRGVIVYKPLRGSAGSGAGAAQTKLAECSQCLYASLAFNVKKGKISNTDIFLDDFKKASKDIVVDENFLIMVNVLSD